jgi:periplasmic protein CpxP/Spy
VADTMRSNAKTIDTLLEQRHENAEKETAVDNLRSWTEVAQAHADGSKALLEAFESLYTDMPDAQKKIADDAFRPAEPHTK